MFTMLRLSALAAVLLGPAAIAAAETLIDASFDQSGATLTGEPAPIGRVWCWTGPEGKPLGQARIATDPDGGDQALALSNNAHPEAAAPAIEIDWRETSAANSTQPLTISYSCLVPVEGEYLCTQFFGDGWENAAAVVIFENGKILLQYGENGARLPLGDYTPNKWVDIRASLDGGKRVVTVYLNDKKVANAVPWQKNAKPVSHVTIIANQRPVIGDGADVLLLDSIKVETGAGSAGKTSE
jgi:hypothetical protein